MVFEGRQKQQSRALASVDSGILGCAPSLTPEKQEAVQHSPLTSGIAGTGRVQSGL